MGLQRRAFLHLGGVLSPLLGWGGARAQADRPSDRPPPIERFFEPPSLSGALLAPDGRALAMRQAAPGGRARLVVLDLAGMKPTVVAEFRDADVGRFDWVDARRLVFDLRTRLAGPGLVDTGSGLFAVDADGSGFRQLVETTRAFVQAQPDGGVPPLRWDTWLLGPVGARRGDEVFVVTAEERSRQRIGHQVLRRLNTRTGRTVAVDAPQDAVHWVADAQGALRAVLSADRDRVVVHWRAVDGQREGEKEGEAAWKRIAERDQFAAGWTPRHVGPDGTVYAEVDHQGFRAVARIDPATGRVDGKPLASVPGFDLHAQFITSDDRLLGLRYVIDAEITQWLDAPTQALQARIDALLPATANRLGLPMRGDSPWVLVESFADVQPMLTHLFHRRTGQLTRVGAARPGIEPRRMGQTDFLRFKARDGQEIPAWLTLPAGSHRADGRRPNLPLVVLVHGGPWVRGAQWEWQDEVQFLASRGYAVLQPEFRGSTGYGSQLFRAGWRQWGQAMQQDLADAARWAVGQGIADARRIAIAGASYGGYATLMGLLQEPDLFRAGVSWAGVTDPALMFSVGWSDVTEQAKTYGLARLVGDPVADAAMLRAASPLAQAAGIRQPLLLAHGAWDLRVPLVHGERFRDANKPHNPGLEWVLYPDEGHGWQRPETAIDFWGRVAAFLDRHLAPR